MQRKNCFQTLSYYIFVILIIFLPFAALLGNILEFKTTISDSQIFWITHWYEFLLPFMLIFGLCLTPKNKKVFGWSFLVAVFLIIYSIILIIFSADQVRSIEGFRFTILPVLFFVIVSMIGFAKEEKNKLVKLYLIVSLVVASWAIIERFLPFKYWNNIGLIEPMKIFGWGWHGAGGFTQSVSFMGGPNQLASYLLPALFLTVYSIRNTDNSKAAHKTVYCLLSTIISLAIILTLSRSAILGMIVGLVVYLLFFNSKKIITYAVSSTFIVAIFLIWLFASSASVKNVITHGGQTGHQMAFVETISEIKTRAMQDQAKLFIGSGLGTAGPLVIKYGNGFISESWYLQILLEIGIVGLLLWIWFMIALSKELLRKKETVLFLGFFAVSFAAIFLHTWADNPALSYSLFILLGITIGEKWQKEY